MRLGIITAMDKERVRISALLENRQEIKIEGIQFTDGRCGRQEILLASSGIGKVNAALCAEAMLRLYHPDALLSTGVAGGIGEQLHVMDVVAGSEYCYHDVWCGKPNAIGQVQGMPERFAGDKKLLDAADMLALMRPGTDGGSRIHRGLIVSGDQFIEDNDKLAAIKADFPMALAVDMESAALAHTCFVKNMPFMSFRIISDVPGTEKHAGQYENFWGELAERSFAITKSFLAALP